MKLKHIEIKNFRNYPELSLAITSDMVVLSGPNAVGKTNLLESVYFGSLFKSFRDDSEFIFMRGASTSSLRMTVEKGSEEHILEIFLEQRDKIYANFKIDGVKQKRRDAQGYLRVVVFEPSDVDLFNRSPEFRRKYLNMVLSQASSQYLEDLASYKKIVAQKTKLLQNLRVNAGTTQDVEIWNDQLVTVGTRIILDRKNYISFLNQRIADIYSNISGFHRPVEVYYETLPGDSEEEVAAAFRSELARVLKRELLMATCAVGPHRDDFFLKSEGLYLSPFSSRGELRSQILSLKILELEFLNQGGDTPVLLLDDVLSELDDVRRTFLLKYLQGKYQTFITTTHPLEMAAQHVTLTPSAQEEA